MLLGNLSRGCDLARSPMPQLEVSLTPCRHAACAGAVEQADAGGGGRAVCVEKHTWGWPQGGEHVNVSPAVC